MIKVQNLLKLKKDLKNHLLQYLMIFNQSSLQNINHLKNQILLLQKNQKQPLQKLK